MATVLDAKVLGAQVEPRERLEETVLRPLTHTSRAWYVWAAALVMLISFGLVAYGYQLRHGLAATGMRDTVIWGLYISNFVFFSGVSMAGTFISAILRITGAEWRRPLTRISELTTVSALLMCGLMPMVDLGRPDRMLNLLLYGRLMSPIVWDIIAITTYLTASAIYLYLFLIPDAAFLRDRLKGQVHGLRHRLYCIAALRWRGVPEQRQRLERAATVMMLLIVPIGVTVHSVVSWIFGMTFRAGWSSTIFAPYFAVGALYSGVAMLITLLYVCRRVYRLEPYFTAQQFKYLGYMLAAFGILYLYFTFAEYLTMAYKLEGGDRLLLEQLFVGSYSYLVWPGFLGGQILPILLVGATAYWRRHVIPILFAASILVNVGMWIKRFIIVVPSLSLPLMPYQWGVYTPTWVEMAITVATFGGFAFVFTMFSKLFPMVSLWEMAEGAEGVESTAHQEHPHQEQGRQITSVSAVNGVGRAAAAVLACVALIVASVGHVHAQAGPNPVKLRVEIADAGFNGKPGEFILDVDEGALVELTFAWAHQGYTREEHVIVLENYKLEWDKIDAQHREATVRFIADKPGSFNFKCDLDCELHNYLQKGYLRVRRGGAGGAAAARTPTKLTVTPSTTKAGSNLVNLMAVLQDNKGAPVSKATVRFFEDAEFAGNKAKMDVGSAKTDANGVALLDYQPTLQQPMHTIIAQFEGMGVFDESQQTIQIQQVGAPASGYDPEPNGLEGLRRSAPAGLVIAVLGVWGVFAALLWHVLGIALVPPGRAVPALDGVNGAARAPIERGENRAR